MYRIYVNEDSYPDMYVLLDKFNYFSPVLDIVIDLSDTNIQTLRKQFKKLYKLRKKLDRAGLVKFFFYGFNKNNGLHQQAMNMIHIIMQIDKDKIYSKAYDNACDYLDNFFYGKNLCDFCDNKCGYKRDTKCEVGCCRHFERHKRIGLLFGEKLVPCEYLGSDGHCTIKCMRCKLFTCDYLEKKGIKFRTKDILYLYCIFNPVQRLILNSIAYTPKNEVLKIVKFFG